MRVRGNGFDGLLRVFAWCFRNVNQAQRILNLLVAEVCLLRRRRVADTEQPRPKRQTQSLHKSADRA